MDPNRAIADIIVALGYGQWGEAERISENLLGWLNRGGFYPDGILVKALHEAAKYDSQYGFLHLSLRGLLKKLNEGE